MANEIFATLELQVDKGGFHLHEKRFFISTMSGLNATQNIQNVGNTEEAIDLGDYTPGGLMLVVNLDDTNYVEIRPGVGERDIIQVEAGQFAFFRLTDDCLAPFAISNTADDNTAEVLFIMIDD